MNILLAYRRTQHRTVGEYLEKALRKEHSVESFDLGKTPYWTNFYNKLPFFIPKGKPVYIQSLIRKFNKSFDVILEVDGAGQYHLSGYKKLNIPTVLWGIDHDPDKIKFLNYFKNDFSYIFYWHKNYPPKLNKKCFWLSFACDPNINRKFDTKKIYDVVFVGNVSYKYCQERIRLLKLIGEKFNLKVFNSVYGEKMAKIYSQAKIVFNKSISGDLNMRVFEAMSCGSLLLTNRLQPEAGLEDLFIHRKHLVLYNDETDLLEKIAYYLKHESEREEIAYNGNKEVVEKHTYEHRAKEMLKIVTGNSQSVI